MPEHEEAHESARLRNISQDHFRRQALDAAQTLGPTRPRFLGGDYAIIATVAACMGLEDYFVQACGCSRVEAQNHASAILGRTKVGKIFFAMENIIAQKISTPVGRLGQLPMLVEERTGFNGTCTEDLSSDVLAPGGEDC